ncbi:hypothetical protein [Larkinella humicola]|uniref:DoxX-like protein n=1 Tax=Larkinella humicola TaxID=2607654 RepID=A0A5N1J2Y0_9BACT|nr:hypothetical protein [Larkinella humicola]KAA9340377.1 hypothetical protein F0P93_31245 [Larkinella humicola]
MSLPKWMRISLWITAGLNLIGAIIFTPSFHFGRQIMDLPSTNHPLYLWIIAEFIFIFGVAYAYCAFTGHAPRILIGVAAAGKLAFFATLVGFWLSAELPVKVPILGSADLIFGLLFLWWLRQTPGDRAGGSS